MIKFNNPLFEENADNQDVVIQDAAVQEVDNDLPDLPEVPEFEEENIDLSDLPEIEQHKILMAQKQEEVPEPPTLKAPLIPEPDAQVPELEVNPEDAGINIDDISSVANLLSEKGLLQYIPDTVNPEELTSESFLEIIQHDKQSFAQEYAMKALQEDRERLTQKLNPLSAQILSYNLQNPHASAEDIQGYLNAVTATEYVSNLSAETDGEQIVREYYKSLSWSNEDIDEKISDLTQLGKLNTEAEKVKPSLEEKYKTIIAEKNQRAAAIKQFEDQQRDTLDKRIRTQLNTGKLNGIPLSREQAGFLYNAIMNDEVPVQMGDKTVQMGFAEALVRQHKYNRESNIEDLMLGLLVISQGTKALEQFYAKQAKTKETEKFVKQTRFSSAKKKGTQQQTTKSNSGPTLNMGMFK